MALYKLYYLLTYLMGSICLAVQQMFLHENIVHGRLDGIIECIAVVSQKTVVFGARFTGMSELDRNNVDMQSVKRQGAQDVEFKAFHIQTEVVDMCPVESK